jgi:polar amino acid transport system substrate-binding protein
MQEKKKVVNMRRIIVLLISLALLIIGLTACHSRFFSKPLRVGMTLNHPPFEMTDADGNPSGVSVDLARDLGKSIGRRIQIVVLPADSLFTALQEKRLDLIVSSLPTDLIHPSQVVFSQPYATSSLAILVTNKADVEKADDLNRADIRITAARRSFAASRIPAMFPKARFFPMRADSVAANLLNMDMADAFISDQLSVLAYWQQNQQTTKLLLTPLAKQDWAIATHTDDVDLRDKVNTFLKNYKTKGGFERLGDKYLLNQKAEFREHKQPFIF